MYVGDTRHKVRHPKEGVGYGGLDAVPIVYSLTGYTIIPCILLFFLFLLLLFWGGGRCFFLVGTSESTGGYLGSRQTTFMGQVDHDVGSLGFRV